MNYEQTPQDIIKRRIGTKKKTLLIIIAVSVAAFVLCGAVVALLENVTGTGSGEVETIDPWLLDETKPEDFDIMEYEEYLALVERNKKTESQ